MDFTREDGATAERSAYVRVEESEPVPALPVIGQLLLGLRLLGGGARQLYRCQRVPPEAQCREVAPCGALGFGVI